MSAETLERQAQRFVETVNAIDAANAALGREIAKVRTQLADALDAIHELKSQIVTKDNIIEELQALQSRGGTR